MENAVGYCRLSDKQESSSSIASQKKRIQEYCERYNLNLLQIFVDDGKSGWTFDRPGFIQLEAFCKKSVVNVYP
jgi:site-specific DNA recombinase